MAQYDLGIIGAGPAGYAAALRGAKNGLKVCIAEKNVPGGVCVNRGCIPSKSLIHSASLLNGLDEIAKFNVTSDKSNLDFSKIHKKARKNSERLSRGLSALFKQNNIDFIDKAAKLNADGDIQTEDGKTISASSVLIATGSEPKQIPFAPFDGERVHSADSFLLDGTLPSEIIILGGGVIGCEFAYILSSMGTKVTIVEMLPSILPNVDKEVRNIMEKNFKKKKITVHTDTKASGLEYADSGIKLQTEDNNIEADMLLVAVGRTPNTSELGLEKLNLQIKNGFIQTGEYYETDTPGIYAAGDIIDTPQLAHLASREGEIVADYISGNHPEKRVAFEDVPFAVYTEPEVAHFGLTEEQLQEKGISYEKEVFQYRGIGKAVATGQTEGIIKILYNTDNIESEEDREIISVHMAGSNATELIHEYLLAAQLNEGLETIHHTLHAHPTLSEGIWESASACIDRGLHV